MSPWPGFAAAALSGARLAAGDLSTCPSRSRATAKAPRAACSIARRCGPPSSLPSIGLLLVASFVAVFSFANFESTLSLQIEQIVERANGRRAQLRRRRSRMLLTGSRRGYYDDPDDAQLIVVFATFAYLGIMLTLAQGFSRPPAVGPDVRRGDGDWAPSRRSSGFVLLAWAADATTSRCCSRRWRWKSSVLPSSIRRCNR